MKRKQRTKVITTKQAFEKWWWEKYSGAQASEEELLEEVWQYFNREFPRERVESILHMIIRGVDVGETEGAFKSALKYLERLWNAPGTLPTFADVYGILSKGTDVDKPVDGGGIGDPALVKPRGERMESPGDDNLCPTCGGSGRARTEAGERAGCCPDSCPVMSHSQPCPDCTPGSHKNWPQKGLEVASLPEVCRACEGSKKCCECLGAGCPTCKGSGICPDCTEKPPMPEDYICRYGSGSPKDHVHTHACAVVDQRKGQRRVCRGRRDVGVRRFTKGDRRA